MFYRVFLSLVMGAGLNACTGGNSQGEVVAQITAGGASVALLKADGAMRAAGSSYNGVNMAAPEGLADIVWIDTDIFITAAVHEDGSVSAWGHLDLLDSISQLRNVQQLSTGFAKGIALHRDGSLTLFDDNRSVTVTSISNVKQIEASGSGPGVHVVTGTGDLYFIDFVNREGEELNVVKFDQKVVHSEGHFLVLENGDVYSLAAEGVIDVFDGYQLIKVVANNKGTERSLIGLTDDGQLINRNSWMSDVPEGLDGVVDIASNGACLLVLKNDNSVEQYGQYCDEQYAITNNFVTSKTR